MRGLSLGQERLHVHVRPCGRKWETFGARGKLGELGWFSQFLKPLLTQTVFLLECRCLITKSCLTLCDPMDCSPPGSSVHGIFQVRLLEWVALLSSKGSSWPRDRVHLSCVEDSSSLGNLGSPDTSVSVSKHTLSFRSAGCPRGSVLGLPFLPLSLSLGNFIYSHGFSYLANTDDADTFIWLTAIFLIQFWHFWTVLESEDWIDSTLHSSPFLQNPSLWDRQCICLLALT